MLCAEVYVHIVGHKFSQNVSTVVNGKNAKLEAGMPAVAAERRPNDPQHISQSDNTLLSPV